MNTDNMIFVFGSNEAGHHGLGAAKFARLHRKAVYGVGFGPTGQSFAIPTLDWRLQMLPLEAIQHYIERFIVCARYEKQVEFQVTAVGCGLAGRRHDVIAPMFEYAPENCLFDELWRDHFKPDTKRSKTRRFWGTFP